METPKWVRSELHCKMFEIFSTGTLPKCEEIFDRSRCWLHHWCWNLWSNFGELIVDVKLCMIKSQTCKKRDKICIVFTSPTSRIIRKLDLIENIPCCEYSWWSASHQIRRRYPHSIYLMPAWVCPYSNSGWGVADINFMELWQIVKWLYIWILLTEDLVCQCILPKPPVPIEVPWILFFKGQEPVKTAVYKTVVFPVYVKRLLRLKKLLVR